MRPAALVALFLPSALAGGAAALAIAWGSGWAGDSTTVVREVVEVPSTPAAPVARPLSGNGFDPAAVYARRSPGVVTIFAFFDGEGDSSASAAQGSGFVVSPRGYILTNAHVITDAGNGAAAASARAAARLYVEFEDHDRVPARVVGYDLFDDVGLLRVDPGAHPLAPLPLGNSAAVVVGEPVAAIGSPFGNENSLAVGVVSATHRAVGSLTSRYDLVDAIQIDAPINHGSSGGPLFDAGGSVIGINAQIRSDSGNAEGVGFAVPINSARRSMAQLIATGKVAYAFAGLTAADLTPSLARRFGYRASYGALIESVEPGYAAANAGLRGGSRDTAWNGGSVRLGGDVIVAIDGREVRAAEDVVRIVAAELSPGQVARFTVLRAGRRLAVPVRLGERPLELGGKR